MSHRIHLGLLELFVVSTSLLLAFPSNGQTIRGKVTDTKDGLPVPGAIIRTLRHDGSTIHYTMTGADGEFSIESGESATSFKTALLGYKEKIFNAPFKNYYEIRLDQEEEIIKEAIIHARKVKMAGDTTIYNVKALSTRDDHVLGDVLKRIPGIEVTSSGHLKVDGRDLGKFYVNGKDVLEGNYNLATRKLSVDVVKKVEVMRNHQYIKMLRGMQESDQAAEKNIQFFHDASILVCCRRAHLAQRLQNHDTCFSANRQGGSHTTGSPSQTTVTQSKANSTWLPQRLP